MSLCFMELVKLLHVHQYSVEILSHILVLQEWCALMGVGVGELSICSHEQIQ